MYDLIVFDLDGTLIDSVGDIADALNRALAELGLPRHPDQAVARMIGNGVVELVRRGDVRRAKLYYHRGRRGKAARIAELATREEASAESAEG